MLAKRVSETLRLLVLGELGQIQPKSKVERLQSFVLSLFRTLKIAALQLATMPDLPKRFVLEISDVSELSNETETIASPLPSSSFAVTAA